MPKPPNSVHLRCHAERRYQHVDQRYQEDADRDQIVDSVRFADLPPVVDIVTAVHNEPNADRNLYEQADRDEDQTEVIVRMAGERLDHVAQLVGVGRHQGQVHHTLGEVFLLLVGVDVWNDFSGHWVDRHCWGL